MERLLARGERHWVWNRAAIRLRVVAHSLQAGRGMRNPVP